MTSHNRLKRIISNHAIIRWLERVKGLDTNKVRNEAMIVTGRMHKYDGDLIRYMRQYHRLDVRAIRHEMVNDQSAALIAAGVNSLPVVNRKFKLKLASGRITTVVT